MLLGIETSNPPYKLTQSKAADELKQRMGESAAVSRMIDMAANYSGIEERYVSIPDADDNAESKFYSNTSGYISPGTGRRMALYEERSKLLTREAAEKLFNRFKIDASEVTRLITISCTGFFAPGFDYHLIKELGLPDSVKRTNIGFMGCAASLVGFNSALEAVLAAQDEESKILLVSVELCSLHLQTEPSRDNILANLIFADGCAAALFNTRRSGSGEIGLDLLSTHSVIFDDSASYMGWKIGDNGFEMMLSSQLPKIISDTAVPKIVEILSRAGVNYKSVKHWALHPGGRAILDSLQTGLGLSEKIMMPSRKVLKNFGNMSSASILFVLKEIIDGGSVKKDDYCCAVAFGPGLTMELALMRGA